MNLSLNAAPALRPMSYMASTAEPYTGGASAAVHVTPGGQSDITALMYSG